MPLTGRTSRWITAIMLMILTIALNGWLQAMMAGRIPFLPFYAAVIAIGYFCGAIPGLAALAMAEAAAAVLWKLRGGAWPMAMSDAVLLLRIPIGGGIAMAIAAVARRHVLELRRTRDCLALALKAARDAEQRFQLALKAGATIAWACDADKRYTWAYNQAAGLRPEDFVGKRIGEIVPLERHPPYAEAIDRVLRTGRGERLPVSFEQGGEARHYIAHIDPVMDATGRVAGLTGVSMDITDMRRAEQAVHESERQMRTISDALPVLISQIDREHRYQFNNAAYERLLGKSAELLRGTHMRDLIGEEAYQGILPSLQRAFSGETSRVVELQLQEGAARGRIVAATYIPLRHGAEVTAVIGLVEDITARKRAEAEHKLAANALREADRRKDEFLATLAHELRNPMAPIRYAAATLKADVPDGIIKHAREVIERQAAQMSRLLDELLDMSRVTRNVVELKREVLDLCRLLNEAVAMAKPVLTNLQHRLQVSTPADSLWVLGDATRLLQVIGNLIDNAAKYTEPGGCIEIRLQSSDDLAVIEVADNGIGLSSEMIPKVFDLFCQVHKSLGKGGLGIGLNVVKRLVELHGGAIEATSEGLHRGARFTVRLPLAAANAAGIERAAPENVVPFLKFAPQVLVVDDNRDAADVLAQIMRTHGFAASVAYDGASALTSFERLNPAVVVLDVGLPDMSGIEIARRIRSRSSGKATHIIAVTGWGQQEDRERSYEAGIDLHLVKPVNPDDLLRVLGRQLAGGTGTLKQS